MAESRCQSSARQIKDLEAEANQEEFYVLGLKLWIYSSSNGMCCFRKLKFKKRKRKQTFYRLGGEHKGLPGRHSDKETAFQRRSRGFDPRIGKIPWRRKCQPTPVFLPGKSHGQRSLVGYSR